MVKILYCYLYSKKSYGNFKIVISMQKEVSNIDKSKINKRSILLSLN